MFCGLFLKKSDEEFHRHCKNLTGPKIAIASNLYSNELRAIIIRRARTTNHLVSYFDISKLELKRYN